MLKARTDIYLRHKTFSWIGIVLVVLAVSGCGTTVPLPDYRYYRPKDIKMPVALERPAIADVLQIDGFRADGVFGERPIAYSSESEPQKLLQYHYQLWTDPPGAILQRRFIDVFTAMKAATSVTARATMRTDPYKLSGLIERLERTKRISGAWEVVVKLRIRVEAPRAIAPILERTYERKVATTSDNISESVELLGYAVDDIAETVARDLLESSKR